MKIPRFLALSLLVLLVGVFVTWDFTLSQQPLIKPIFFGLKDLKDVSVDLAPANGQVLTFNSTLELWDAGAGGGGGSNLIGPVTVTENSDVLTFTLTTTDSYVKWSDGALVFMTDEGTNTYSTVEVKPKGTSEIAQFRLYDTDGIRLLLSSDADRAFIQSQGGALGFQKLVVQDVKFWEEIASGNPTLSIYGWNTAGGDRESFSLSMSDTNDEAVLTIPSSANNEGFTVQLGEANQLFRVRASGGSVVASITDAGKLAATTYGSAGTVTDAELTYLADVTGAIQAQIDGKAVTSHAMSTHSDEDTYNISTSGLATVTKGFVNGAETTATPSAGFTVDWTAKQVQRVTITGATLDVTFTNPAGPCRLVLVVVQGDGDDTIDWTNEADILWPGGVAPTLSTGAADIDVVTFYFDGTSYLGIANYDFQ